MNSNQAVTIIRAGVAAAVGYLIAFAAAHGFPSVDPAVKAVIITAIVGVVTPLYYSAVAWLEKRWPWLGHLLLVTPPKADARPQPVPPAPRAGAGA